MAYQRGDLLPIGTVSIGSIIQISKDALRNLPISSMAKPRKLIHLKALGHLLPTMFNSRLSNSMATLHLLGRDLHQFRLLMLGISGLLVELGKCRDDSSVVAITARCTSLGASVALRNHLIYFEWL